MGYDQIKDLRIFKQVEEISDKIWNEVVKWDNFAKFTVGNQLVRAIDSVTANLEESNGRFHYKDKLNFLYIARGSLMESRHWLMKINKRKLFSDEIGDALLSEIENVLPQFNAFISSQKKEKGK